MTTDSPEVVGHTEGEKGLENAGRIINMHEEKHGWSINMHEEKHGWSINMHEENMNMHEEKYEYA